MIIDGHAHACGEFVDVPHILKNLDTSGADAVVLAPSEPGSPKTYFVPNLARHFPRPVWMMPINRLVRAAAHLGRLVEHLAGGNEQVFQMHKQIPQRILQSFWLDARVPDPPAFVEAMYRRMGFAMLKLHQCWTPFDPAGPMVHDLADWCARRDIPLFAHLYSPRDVNAYYNVVRERPGTTFILAHCIDVRVIAEKPRVENLYFDISPPDLVGEWQIRKAIDIVGANHVLLGSDTPYGRDNLARNIARVRAMNLPPEAVDNILGRNLAGLLSLPS